MAKPTKSNKIASRDGDCQSRWRCFRMQAANVAMFALALLIAGCSGVENFYHENVLGQNTLAPAAEYPEDYNYLIGPGDSLNIFVWRNPELSTVTPVRPDGKFSTNLVEDLIAAGKTPTQLAREIEQVLSEFIRDPYVTVTVDGFVGEYYEQIRVLGEATQPQSIPYKKNMTVLDVMISVGGLTDFAAGNRAALVRNAGNGNSPQEFRVRLEDLVKDGDISANVAMQPGDVIIIPEAWF